MGSERKNMGEQRARRGISRRPEYGRGGVLYRVHPFQPCFLGGVCRFQRCERIGCERRANTPSTLSWKLSEKVLIQIARLGATHKSIHSPLVSPS